MQEKTLDELAISYKENGSEKVFMEIVKRLRPLIIKRSAGAIAHSISRDDIEQASALAIATAILRFDPERGAFQSYVVSFVIGELRREAGLSMLLSQPKSASHRYLMNHGPRFISTEMANGAGIHQAIAAAATHFGTTAEEVEASFSWRAAVSESGVEQADTTEHGFSDEKRSIVLRAMKDLTDAERAVISSRYLRETPDSVYETAKAAGICFQNVSRKAQNAIVKMRSTLEKDGIFVSDVF